VGNRAEIVVLAILLGLVGVIIVSFFLALGLFGIGVTHQGSGSGGVVVVSSCPAPPSGAQVASSC
jgi:hypothetical protein